MKIKAILEKAVPIASEIKNAYINFAEMDVSIAAIVSDVIRDGEPVVGFGFNSNGRYAQSGIIRNRLIPRILNAKPENLLTDDGKNFDPQKIWNVMMSNEKPGGHGERSVAVGVLDMAFWDLASKIALKPLYQFIAEKHGNPHPHNTVSVYAAGGYYYPGKDIESLQNEMKRYLDLGYIMVKMKIGAASLAEDIKRIEAVIKIIKNPSNVAVDANGRFDKKTALEYTRILNELEVAWYEEPCDPLDFEILTAVCHESTIPIATGENLFSHQDSRNLLRYGGMRKTMDVLQMDPALSYGLVEYLKTLDVLKEYGWSPSRCIPHGGHQFALQIAAGLGLGGNESYPGVFEPFGSFADGIEINKGQVKNPDIPGIGIELKSSLYPLYLDLLK